MKIKNIQITNYKGFRNGPIIELSDRVTVVVGQNNSGKTAFLEAFNLHLAKSKPHLSISTPRGGTPSPTSRFQLTAKIGFQEIRVSMLRTGLRERSLPIDRADNREEFFKSFKQNESIEYKLATHAGGGYQSVLSPSHGLFNARGEFASAVMQLNEETRDLELIPGLVAQGDNIVDLFMEMVPRLVYVFKAERLGIGRFQANQENILEPDASNLPAVLKNMSENPYRFAKFNSYVKEIFPSIHDVVVAMDQNAFEIKLWVVDPATERDDLTVKLSESGTGVGQVLAILYVAMTLDKGVIVIDEPNSFLHPGAAKKLMAILLENYSQHQYIISTHSPELITACNPDIIQQITWEGGESRCRQLDRKSIEDTKSLLDDLGVSLSDVFSADSVIWVEGQTEAEVFPLIYEEFNGRMPAGMSFVAIKHTGDFESKKLDASSVFSIYERLTSASGLIPSAVSFSFDRESRDEAKLEDLRRHSIGKVHFLPRRTYENYLIHAGAISAILSNDMQNTIAISDIEQWLAANSNKICKCGEDILSARWHVVCDAPKLLDRMFSDLSEAKVTYRKTTHSVQLTRWLLKNDTHYLKEVGDYLSELC